MKKFDQLIDDLEDRLRREVELTGDVVPRQVASWILKEYEPPVEWEVMVPDGGVFGKRILRVRMTIAGQFFDQRGGVTEEQLVREERVLDRIKETLRCSLGRSVINFLDRGND